MPVKGIFLEVTSTDDRGLRSDRLWRLECPLPPAVAGLRLILRGCGGVGGLLQRCWEKVRLGVTPGDKPFDPVEDVRE